MHRSLMEKNLDMNLLSKRQDRENVIRRRFIGNNFYFTSACHFVYWDLVFKLENKNVDFLQQNTSWHLHFNIGLSASPQDMHNLSYAFRICLRITVVFTFFIFWGIFCLIPDGKKTFRNVCIGIFHNSSFVYLRWQKTTYLIRH